jgi:hypothetical protein
MPCQPENGRRPLPLTRPLGHSQAWQSAFVGEWCRLAEGLADEAQTCEAANELYLTHGGRDPVEVAREDWGEPV